MLRRLLPMKIYSPHFVRNSDWGCKLAARHAPVDRPPTCWDRFISDQVHLPINFACPSFFSPQAEDVGSPDKEDDSYSRECRRRGDPFISDCTAVSYFECLLHSYF